MFIMPGIEAAAPERTETSSGFLSSPNFLPSFLFQHGDVLADFVHQARRAASCRSCSSGRRLGGDGEAGGHRQADAGHVGQVGAFAAEELLLLAVAFGLGLAEVVGHLGRRRRSLPSLLVTL